MYKPKWEKILYKKQKFADNYMEYDKKEDIEKKIDFNSINKFILSITSTYLFFSLHIVMDKVRSDIWINFLLLAVLVLSYKCAYNVKELKTFVKLSSIIIFWIYLLSPIFLTLTREVDTDTIYLCFALLQLVYSIDNVKCDILEDNEQNTTDVNQTQKFSEENENKNKMYKKRKKNVCQSKNKYKTSLGLEDTYMNYRKYNISIFGYCCSILGSILLCSRYKNVDDVFLHLTFNLTWFILFPYYRKFFTLDKNLYFLLSFILVCIYVTKLCNTVLFVVCIFSITAVYTLALFNMCIAKYLTN